jgi:hypothetical protein
MRYRNSILVGLAIGYLLYVVIQNISSALEDYPFMSIRQWATGHTMMSDIKHHPADIYVRYSIVAGCLFCGVMLSLIVTWWIRQKSKRKNRTSVPTLPVA